MWPAARLVSPVSRQHTFIGSGTAPPPPPGLKVGLPPQCLTFMSQSECIRANALRLSRASIYTVYRRHNYIYLLRFKVLMAPIILVFIKLMGAAISGHWDLRDTGTTRDYDTLARSLGWQSGSGPGWQSHKNVTFSPVGHV